MPLLDDKRYLKCRLSRSNTGRLESLEKFSAVGIETLQLDVTSGDSVAKAVASVLDATDGTLDVLICNAGCTFNGPLAEQACSSLSLPLNQI